MDIMPSDIAILRELAKKYAELAAKPIQEERRDLWTAHNSLEPTRPPILVRLAYCNAWVRKMFGDGVIQCQDPLFRDQELYFRLQIFHDQIGDDHILEPWVTIQAQQPHSWNNLWGLRDEADRPDMEGGACRYHGVLTDWNYVEKLSWPPHQPDEMQLQRDATRLQDAIGDLVSIDVSRTPTCTGWLSDISTTLARLRGLEQLMMDMYDSPGELHRLLGWMRDGILANQQAGEKVGHWSLTAHQNQEMPYARELAGPAPNSPPVTCRELWHFCAAQEYTLVSPAMHEEFLFQYQKPICERFGLVAYGCCENLTGKIDMLRSLKNLRVIAVAPSADIAGCAQAIGADYVFSWRPNPTDMVSTDWDEGRIRRLLSEGLRKARGCRLHIHLKDVETVEDDPSRLARWVAIARQTCEKEWR